MFARQSIIRELRILFKQGATPSRLLRHILRRLPGEAVTAWVLRDYLEQAFCLSTVRLQPGIDYSHDHPCFVALNRTLIPEVIQHRHEWDVEPDVSDDSMACWFDGLISTPPDGARDAADLTTHPNLSDDTWANLSPDEQDALRLQLAGIQTTAERVTLLVHLVERLQQQVEAMEQQLKN